MKESILDVLARGEIIIGDGAFGTQLQARGLPPGMMPEKWNDENAEAVLAVHRGYIEAGADFITTNTFGANRIRLGEAGMGDKVAEMNRLGVLLVRKIVGDKAWVAASVGPTGQLMEPFGTLSIALAEELYAEQVIALAEAGADLIIIETQHDVEEACAAVRMAKEKTDLPVFCSFAFNPKGRTMMGLKPDVAAKRVQEAGGDVVGANCGDGPAAIIAALEGMEAATDLPLLAQSNAGIPQMGENAETIWDVTPEQMAEHARTFVSLGARVVGGCCGTGPEHIAAIVAALK